MYFTLVFKNDSNEGPTLSYDVCFHPCVVWYCEGKDILIPNPKIPGYNKGFLNDLFQKESITDFPKKDFKVFNKVLIICHEQGHGYENDLRNLQADLKEEAFTYQVLK